VLLLHCLFFHIIKLLFKAKSQKGGDVIKQQAAAMPAACFTAEPDYLYKIVSKESSA